MSIRMSLGDMVGNWREQNTQQQPTITTPTPQPVEQQQPMDFKNMLGRFWIGLHRGGNFDGLFPWTQEQQTQPQQQPQGQPQGLSGLVQGFGRRLF